MRLLTPWPELSKFAEGLTKDIDNLEALEHSHIPYLVLLLYFLGKWKETHGKFPSNYTEKMEFRKTIAAGARTSNAEGGEENFDEAVAAAVRAITPPSLSSSAKEVFAYEPNEVNTRIPGIKAMLNEIQVESESSFWVIVDAIKQFYEMHKELPLPGSVPDMKAQSTVYVQLQNIYKAKARQDVAEVLKTVRAHPKGESIDTAQVEAFCKNAAFIKLVNSTAKPPASIQALASMKNTTFFL